MQHREIFTAKYLREIGKHFDLERARVLALREQIHATDSRIDDMVFDLYGLTAEERALVLGEAGA